jgi:DNA-binding NarL/FixJ family response regulator
MDRGGALENPCWRTDVEALRESVASGGQQAYRVLHLMPFLTEPRAVQTRAAEPPPDAEGTAHAHRAAESAPVQVAENGADRSGFPNRERETEPIKVLFVDDRRIVAEALASLLGRYGGIEVIGWVNALADAGAVVATRGVDVVIVDYRLSRGAWAHTTAAIRMNRLETAVIVINAEEDDEALIDAIEAAVTRYLVKSASTEDLVAAVVAAKGDQNAPLPARALANLLLRQREQSRSRSERAELLAHLTPREREILEMMAQGYGNRAMASQLGIGYSTVRSHVSGLLGKLGVHSKLEAVAKAGQLGLVQHSISP